MTLKFSMFRGEPLVRRGRMHSRFLLLAIMMSTYWSAPSVRAPAQTQARDAHSTADVPTESAASARRSTPDPDFVELCVPLVEGRSYQAKAFLEELERKLPRMVSTTQVDDRRCQIDLVTRAALEALHLAYPSEFQYRIEQHQMVLRIKHQDRGLGKPFWRKLIAELVPAPPQGLRLPKSYDPSLRSALLVHGLESSSAGMQAMREALQEESVQVLLFDYPNDGPIRDAGRMLREALLDLSRKHPHGRVTIIAHSMGGLVARYALESTEPPPGCVTDLFLIATPNKGSRLGLGQEWLECVQTVQSVAAGRVTRTLLGHTDDGRGEAASDLTPGSPFLRELEGLDRPKGVRYHVAAGRRGFLDEDQQRTLVDGVGTELRRRGVPRDRRERIVDFLSAPELCHGSGDGAVTLDSATLTDVTASRTFDLNHIALIRPHNGQEGYRTVLAWILDTLDWRENHGGRGNGG